MSNRFQELYKTLGVDVAAHDMLMKHGERAHERAFLWQKNRPERMEAFDEALHESHGTRVQEVFDFRKKGGKSMGTFCIYVPDEIALAAGVLPVPLCGGSDWPVNHADKMFPRDICPLVRSTFGMSLSGT